MTRSVNNLNKAKQKNNSSGITGVRWHAQRKKWRAQFRDKYLGLFATIEEAEYAYKAASDGFITERHGEEGSLSWFLLFAQGFRKWIKE